MDDYQRKFYAQEKIRPFDEKKARWWYPYRGSEKVKEKEKDPSQSETGNRNANEAFNEILNKIVCLPIMKYEAVKDLTDWNKKKIQEEI